MADNVDYNALKHLIKERTTNIQTNPVTIPGQGLSSDPWTQLETELFPILWQQHECVSLFTKSKYGEINRRLDELEKRLKRLTQRPPAEAQNSPPIQHTRRYARLVQDTDSVSEDIQSLSQFANTQRLAFKKILKKYRKWTGSPNLQLRVNNEIMNQPISFLRPDFSPFLERLSRVTLALSWMIVPMNPDQAENDIAKDGTLTISQQSSIAQLHEAAVGKSALKFDAAFSSVPLGHNAGRAAYWIHPDNIFEVEVLLLRHMKNKDSKEEMGSGFSRRIHSAIFDNLQRYVQEQGATTVAQIEDMEGSVASKIALNILWAEEEDAVMIASDLSPIKTNANIHHRLNFVRRIDLSSCLAKYPSSNGKFHGDSDPQRGQNSSKELRDFIAQHRDVKPLTEIHSTRERFAGINNSKDVGVWALLEQDITMSPLDLMRVGARLKSSTERNYTIESAEGRAFPYAVLQIRWEFSRIPEIVRTLDNSHLAERVRGFTLEAEAIYTICSPEGMAKPLWQSLLGRDIRKVPPLKSRRSTRRSNEGSSSPEEPFPPTSATSSTGGPSDSVFSNIQGYSSATSVMDPGPNITGLDASDLARFAFDPQKVPKQKKTVRLNVPSEPEMATRYWNEFDDGSEPGEDSSYAIYVNPDESLDFPGTEAISKAFSVLYGGLTNGKRHILSWLSSPSSSSKARERESLLAGPRVAQYLEDSSDTESNAKVTQNSPRRRSGNRAGSRAASGSRVRQSKVQKSRETLIFRTYLAAFLLSYVMLIMSAVLQSTGRHRAKFEVDTGVVIGVVIALFCGIGGVCLMVSRRDPLTMLHRVAVTLAFCIVCAGSGYLLALVATAE